MSDVIKKEVKDEKKENDNEMEEKWCVNELKPNA